MVSKNSSPLVSVVLAVKNGERYVAQAIESILSSDYKNFELLVIDGHSDDGTPEVVGRYPEAKFCLQETSGIAAAWNQGISMAAGELIAFMSSDDLWMPAKLGAEVAELERDNLTQYVVGHVSFFLEPGCSIPKGFRADLLLEAPKPAFIMETLLARKSLFNEVGKFDTTLTIAEDVDWFARVRDMGIKGSVLPEALVRKRVHDQNTSLMPDPTFLLQSLHRSAVRKRGTHS